MFNGDARDRNPLTAHLLSIELNSPYERGMRVPIDEFQELIDSLPAQEKRVLARQLLRDFLSGHITSLEVINTLPGVIDYLYQDSCGSCPSPNGLGAIVNRLRRLPIKGRRLLLRTVTRPSPSS